ncbi:MAG TPA: hypothetical protein VHE82_13305 [Gemmatimonadaceae bacterium]|nr:hypothetical protein [Gemmatimonadaceae bacterium]
MKKIGAICVLAILFACKTDKFTGVPTDLSSFFAIRLTPEAASLGVGQTQQLTVTAYDNAACPTGDTCNVLTPGNAVTVPGTPRFSSTDTTKVKVDSISGVVTAIAAGTANVIASLQDIPATGSGLSSVTKADTTAFTITSSALTFGGMTLTANRASAGVTSTDTLLVTITDASGATITTQRAATITGTSVGRPQFYSNKPWIATVGSTGIITGIEPGTATITAVKSIGDVTTSATFDITITDPITGTFSIMPAVSGSGIVFFPGSLTVSATEAVVEGKAGAIVTWTVVKGTFTPTTTPNSTDCFNITFANPSAAQASTTGGASGDIGKLCNSSTGAAVSVSRLFTTPGTYTLTNSTTGASSTLIVK